MKKMTFFHHCPVRQMINPTKVLICWSCIFCSSYKKKIFWALLLNNVRFSNRKVSSLHASDASPSVCLCDCFFCRWLALLCLPVFLQLIKSNWRLQWACRSRNASQQKSGGAHQHHLLDPAHCGHPSNYNGIFHALEHHWDPSSHLPKFRQKIVQTPQKVQAPNWTGMDFCGQIQRILAIDPSPFMTIFRKQNIDLIKI